MLSKQLWPWPTSEITAKDFSWIMSCWEDSQISASRSLIYNGLGIWRQTLRACWSRTSYRSAERHLALTQGSQRVVRIHGSNHLPRWDCNHGCHPELREDVGCQQRHVASTGLPVRPQQDLSWKKSSDWPRTRGNTRETGRSTCQEWLILHDKQMGKTGGMCDA